jgi:ubiquinone/menaquinone biosynthesis C-methylase UbiE
LTHENDIDYWRRDSIWGNALDRSLHQGMEWLLEKWLFARSAERLSEMRILSGGCATGRIEFYMESRGARNIRAFDFVPEFVENARRNAKLKGSGISFFHADMRDLRDVRDESQDYVVYMNRLLCCVDEEDLDRALAEARRILSYGGILLLDVLDYDSRKWNAPLSLFLKAAWALQGKKLRPQTLPRIRDKNGAVNMKFWGTNQNLLYWFKKEELKRKLEKNGFETMDIAKEADIFSVPEVSYDFYVACGKMEG